MAHQWPAGPNQAQFDYEPPRVCADYKGRKDELEAYGNAVLPQVIFPIAVNIRDSLRNP